MDLDRISKIAPDPEVLDEETWEAPRRLSRDDFYAESGCPRWAAWFDAQEA